jgi:hypothetical protein
MTILELRGIITDMTFALARRQLIESKPASSTSYSITLIAIKHVEHAAAFETPNTQLHAS